MYNYTKKNLDTIANETGFIRDNLEKVLRLCEILQFLNENGLFVENLALKGGTAINLTIFALPRLSIDINLDFTKECSREEMLTVRELINKNLLNYMFSLGYYLSPVTKNPYSLDSWVFYFQNSAGNRDVLKVEINYSMRNHILPAVRTNAKVDFTGIKNEIMVLQPLELFGSKITALIARSAPRDMYDVNNMLKYHIFDAEEQNLLRKISIFYMVVGGDYSKMDFNYTKISNTTYPQIRKGLIPLLKKSEHFDFEQVKIDVKNFVSGLMIPTDSEKRFVEEFNNGNYKPGLLFDEPDILERIKNHPMAEWKTKTHHTGI